HLAADRPRRPERTAGHLRAVLQQELHRAVAFMRGPLIEPSRKRVAALRTPDNSVIGVKLECSENRDCLSSRSRRRFLTPLSSFFEPDLLKKQIGHQSSQP